MPPKREFILLGAFIMVFLLLLGFLALGKPEYPQKNLQNPCYSRPETKPNPERQYHWNMISRGVLHLSA